MKILFLSDFLPSSSLQLEESFIELIEGADKIVFNLEGSLLTGINDKSSQMLPFRIDELISFIDKYGRSKFVIALANNHILDNGKKVFKHLVEFLQQNDICYFGTIERPYVLIEHQVGILNFVTAETLAVFSGRKSLNYLLYRKQKILNQIRELERFNIPLILYPHWGRDMERFTFKTYRLNIDYNKWIIFGHHPHVIGEMKENFIYSMGNTFIPHPNYYKRFSAVKYGIAAVYDTLNKKYNLKLTEVFSCDNFKNDFRIRSKDFTGIPSDVINYNRHFSLSKRIWSRLFWFKGNIFDLFKLYFLQLVKGIFKFRHQLLQVKNK